MRLFIGLEIPDNVKEQINQYLIPIHQSEKGWEKPHDYHQTLLFIGEASPVELEIIKDRLQRFEFHKFELQPEKFAFFSRRIMYLSFLKSADLLELKLKIDETFPEWFMPEAKPFISHVTVKRWQRYEHNHLTNSLLKQDFQASGFEVSGIALFKSEKDAENNKYHVIFRKNFIKNE